jgi:tetratricopeptide (TPR) repeat protein
MKIKGNKGASVRTCLTATIAVIVVAAAPAFAQNQAGDQSPAACLTAGQSPDATITACTNYLQREVSEHTRRLAVAFTIRGSALAAKRDLAHAATDFAAAIASDPNFAPAYEARGTLLRENKQCDSAVADFSKVIALEPKRVNAYIARGLCLLSIGQAEGAKADFDQVISLDAKNTSGLTTPAWSAKARIELQRGAFDRAIADYDEVIRLNPKLASAYIERGSALSKVDKTDAALADLDKAIALDPKNAEGSAVAALMMKASVHDAQGNADAALADYGAAITLDPHSVSLFLSRANFFAGKNDDEHALADYTDAIKLDPKIAPAYSARGDFFRNRGDYEKAVADYDKVIENQPGDLTGYGNRALAEFYAGDFAKAAADFKKVIAGQPNTYSLLWLYLSSARASPRDALSDLTAASAKLAADWPTPMVQMFLGRKAVDAAVATAATSEQKCEAQFYSGEWQLLHKAKPLAQNALQAAVDSCPKDFAEYRGAVEELKRLQ